METSCFNRCISLKYINFPKRLLSIYSFSFHGCKELIEIKLPYSLIYLGQYAFAHCNKINNIIIPPYINEIGVGLVINTNIKKIMIPRRLRLKYNKLFFTPENYTIEYY
jgi:hypothetical protein